jgi:hypothetical protein
MRRTPRAGKALLVSALAACAAALPASPAAAGTYDAWSCRTPQGAAAAVGNATAGWRSNKTGHNFLVSENRCADAGFFGGRFTNTQPVGAWIDWQFHAPANTTIKYFLIHWAGVAGGTNGSSPAVGDVSLIRSDQSDPNYAERHYGGGAFRSYDTPLGDVNKMEQGNLDVSWVRVGGHCSPSAGQSGSCTGSTMEFRVFRSKFTLQDSSAPTVGSISGDALSDGTFSGTETISVNASDTGSGVYRLIVSVDGRDRIAKVINSDGGRCADVDPSNANPHEFVHAQPCPLSNSGDVDIDTTSLPEGQHSMRLLIEDAAGNRTTAWGPTTKQIDNVPPPAPSDPDGSGPQVGRPTVVGVAKEGNTLVADPGSWSGEDISFAYAWERCDAAGANCAPIAGATDKTRTLDGADVGKRLRVVVTATNAEGSTPAASDVTNAVVAAGCTNGCATPSTGPNSGSGSGGADGAGGSSRLADGAVNGLGASVLAKVSAAYNGQRVIRTRWGRRVLVTGKLLNEHGSPVTGAVIDILQRPRSGGELRVIGTVTSGSDGTFGYLLPVGSSRLVRFAYRYRGGLAEYTHVSDVEVHVKARVALRATRRVKGRRPLRFRGKVPAALPGSVVLLQAKVGSRWQIFEKARIRGSRRFSAKYVFRRTTRPTTFSFRVTYPGRDTANLDTARSRVVRVRYTP